jgi:multidrug efflux pump subunit AcrA (membrane-fusion protein)
MATVIKPAREKKDESEFAYLFLSGCHAGGLLGIHTTPPEPLPTIALDNAPNTAQPMSPDFNGGVSASGNIIPAQEAHLSFPAGGIVDAVNVAVGDQVEAGGVLVSLAGSEKWAAAVDAARLETLAAQQELLDAQQARQVLFDNLPEAQTNAHQELNEARQALKDADRKVAGLRTDPTRVDLEEAQATLILAKDRLDKAEKDYKEYANTSEKNLIRAAMLNKVAQARRDYDNALRRYNNQVGGSTEFSRSQALAEQQIATAQLELAQRDYDELQQGPDPEKLALADKRIETANGRSAASISALAAAQAALADLELKAPFTGTVGVLNIHLGEWVVPGQPVLVLADLDHLRVEATDLSERDVPQVKKGQKVIVLIKALNQEAAGYVTQIAPLADTLGGDVVYKTTIELDMHPEGLLPGISVGVRFADGS